MCIRDSPQLFDVVEEELGMLDIQEQRLDLLRQAALVHLSENSHIERGDLLKSLGDEGFESEMRGMLCEKTYTHAGFIRPETDIEEVQEGWKRAITLYRQS